MANPRTFKLDPHPMKGDDVKLWQKDVAKLFKDIGIKCPIVIDGVYAQATRSFTAELCEAYGLVSKMVMKDGVTPELRIKLRNKDFNKAEQTRMESKARKGYRAKLRARWAPRFNDLVHSPVSKIIADSWGFHPGVHDGLDVISIEGAAAFAMVRSKIIDVRPHGWWGRARRRHRPDGGARQQRPVQEGSAHRLRPLCAPCRARRSGRPSR
jgi:hypothetical protein